MILDKVNPNDLYPTEEQGPIVLGTIEYNMHGTSEFEGAFIATNERLILNVDEAHDDSIQFVCKVGPMPMKELQKGDIQTFVDYVKSQMPS